MSGIEWILGVVLVTIYIACLFTVCALTFQKGRTWLGIIGIFFPVLWLVGAILPAKPGSPFDIEQQNHYRVTLIRARSGNARSITRHSLRQAQQEACHANRTDRNARRQVSR